MEYNLKTAVLVKRKVFSDLDNLEQTGKALNADFITYDEADVEQLGNYDCIIVIDNKNYKILQDLPQRIRKRWPKMFMEFHQESEITNIFRRHANHGDDDTHLEDWDYGSLKVWEFVQACDFVITHNIY